jgi:DNA repair protein RecO (recombination protein O)
MTDSLAHRERIVQTEAIVLRRVDLREMDRIFVILSDRYGKFSVIAKGVRRPTARAASHLELFARTRLSLAKGRDLDVVTGAESINLHMNLRSDLTAMAMASHVVELVDQFLPEREVNLRSYRLLGRALDRMDQGDSPARIARWFEMQLLVEVGIRPELFSCVECGRAVSAEANAISVQKGGVLCVDHSQRGAATIVSLPAQKVLRLLLRDDLDGYLRLATADEVDAEIEQVITAFLRYQLERDLRSLRVMRRVEETIPIWESAYKSTK